MKTTTLLLLAFGLASQTALAQLRPPPEQAPDPRAPSGAAQPQPRSPSSDTPSATGSDTSGASPARGSGASGTSSGTMPDSSGSSDTPASASPGMQTEAGVELRPAPPVKSLEPKTQGDITYLCGGVGKEEARFMKRQARDYDMMLTFATRKGEYLSDVNVDIKDANGNDVLQTSCDGPMLLIDLPKSGTYRIQADAAGYTLDRSARVQVKQKKGASVASSVWMVWPQRVASAPTAAGTASGSSGGGNNNNSGQHNNSGQ